MKNLDSQDSRHPEEYLAMDDYTVWTAVKNCEKAKHIIENLERTKNAEMRL